MSSKHESAANDVENIQVIPTGSALGAEIAGVDLRHPLADESVQKIRQSLLDYCVVFFRDQQITEPDQVRFTSYFGRAVEHVRKQRDRPTKEIFIVSNVKENGEPIGALGNETIDFHSDLSFLEKPGTISILYAVEIPSIGGATQWANCYAAYEALDDSMKVQLAGLRAVHRHYVAEQNPPHLVDHPIVRTHPESGRKSLYVGPHLTKSIVGLDESESHELLQQLFQHIDQPQFVWTHQWQVGDLVMWDNRPTLHRRLAFPENERRIMKRTQIFGDEVPCE